MPEPLTAVYVCQHVERAFGRQTVALTHTPPGGTVIRLLIEMPDWWPFVPDKHYKLTIEQVPSPP